MIPSSQPSAIPSTMPSAQPSESPSANPSRGCENLRTDWYVKVNRRRQVCSTIRLLNLVFIITFSSGWGIFNPWTCQCDCPVGICLDNNQQCYTPCAETINTNPFAGCSSGWDCPWFPDTIDGYCKSEMHPTQQYEIYRTAKECCDEHFGGSTCLQKSQDSHAPFPWPIHFPGTPEHRQDSPDGEVNRQTFFFPDLHNKLNCVQGRNYESWMLEPGYLEHYLFIDGDECCELWYPAEANCPDSEPAVNPEEEHAAWYADPYPNAGYFFPDFTVSSCGFGTDYPSWYGSNGYEKWYLFRAGSECCTKYFPRSSNCPYEDETSYEPGYYWESYQNDLPNDSDAYPVIRNDTFYPDINAGTCVNGTDYPDWMLDDVEFRRMYLYKEPEGCCKFWFGESTLSSCMNSIIAGVYVNANSTDSGIEAERLTKWYPAMRGNTCRNDKDMPSWMLTDEYATYYLFGTFEQCCAAFGC